MEFAAVRSPLITRLAAALSLALVATAGYAQSVDAPVMTGPDTTVLPVLNNANGKLEALLLLDPGTDSAWAGNISPLDRVIGPKPSMPAIGAAIRGQTDAGTIAQASLKLEHNNGLALLCNSGVGLTSSLGALAQNCQLATIGDSRIGIGDPAARYAPRLAAEVRLERPVGNVALSLGVSRGEIGGDVINPAATGAAMPAWLSGNPLSSFDSRLQQYDTGVSGQLNLGSNGWLSIGGTIARARLIPAPDTGGTALHWNTKAVSVGGGYGPVSGAVTGHVIDVPGYADTFTGVDLGVTWRTPWSGKLTVGAKNIISNGKNPLVAPEVDDDGDQSVPYVRYQQDL